MNKALHIPLEEFLRPFFGPGERICLRVFDDKKTGAFKGAKLETTLSGLPGLMDTLKKHNEQNRGIYFVVNFGGHEDAEISRVNAQFMECDELPLDEQMKQIEAFPLAPSLIVKTRKSLHTYWLIKDGDVAAFRRIQKRLVAQFHGDRSCVNESRVLRLPGFNHCIRSCGIRRPSWNNICRRSRRNPLHLPGQRPRGRGRDCRWFCGAAPSCSTAGITRLLSQNMTGMP